MLMFHMSVHVPVYELEFGVRGQMHMLYEVRLVRLDVQK